MTVLIVDQFGTYEFKETQFIPRIGDSVSWKYIPTPKVSSVVLWPTKGDLGVPADSDIDAIIILS